MVSLMILSRGSCAAPAHIFGCAVCDEAHYMKNASYRNTHAIEELKVRSLAFLIGTPMINRTHDLAGLLTLAWEIELEP